jgi:hypothetical protein
MHSLETASAVGISEGAKRKAEMILRLKQKSEERTVKLELARA